ncbi:unnamed protein product [Pedinophyceae sp. YPF-701]|nr:unnamed protein product [Pedinophyceae sp. YPF-701]
MILSLGLDPIRIMEYVWPEMLLSIASSALCLCLYSSWGASWAWVDLPAAPLSVFSFAIAFFVGLRSNASYQRWLAASTAWVGVTAACRNFARLVLSFTDARKGTDWLKCTEEVADKTKRELINRQMAIAHALRLSNRRQKDVEEWHGTLSQFLSKDDMKELPAIGNTTVSWLMMKQGMAVHRAIAQSRLQPFDQIALETTMGTLQQAIAAATVIALIPQPAQYTQFTRFGIWVFILATPWCLIGSFNEVSHEALVVPVSMLLAFILAFIDAVGRIVEQPMMNRPQDVPLSLFCWVIERDLRMALGDRSFGGDPPPPLTYRWVKYMM